MHTKECLHVMRMIESHVCTNCFRIHLKRIPCLRRGVFTILKHRAALEHLTFFLLNPWLFRVPEVFIAVFIATILDFRLIHGILRVLQETFLKPSYSRRTTLSYLRKFEEFGIFFSRIET